MGGKTFIDKNKMDSVGKGVKTGEKIFIDKNRKDSKEKDKKIIKLHKLKKKRLIIRNLSFKVSEEDLKKIFSEFGKVLEVIIPLKDGKKRGFAFVQFEETKSLIKSMKALNYKPICGRPVAIDYAIDKTKYQQKVQNIVSDYDCPVEEELLTEIKTEVKSESEESEQENDDDVKSDSDESIDEKRANKFLKEFGVGNEIEQDLDDEVSSNESDDDDEDASSDDSEEPEMVEESDREKNQMHSKKISNDVSQGKTVFIRNLSFSTNDDDLQEIMEEYGECEYCLICIDKLTEHPKGTAFVKFKDKNSADKLINQAEKDPGVFLDGRRLTCNYAVSREELSHTDDLKKPKDKRNLNYLKYSLIMPNSKEAEGMSRADMIKRQQLEYFKKGRLKTTNFCVSDKRLIIHNLPEKFTDIELRKLFKNASGKGAVITEARIMRDFKKVDSKGFPVSKGFGFVGYTQHEDALKALMELNNNPSTFTPHKRPIVEFSVENKVALLSKERKKEKNVMRNKKRTEKKNERRAKGVDSNQTEKNSKENSSKSSKRKRKRREMNAQKGKTVPIQKDETDLEQMSESPKKRKRTEEKNECRAKAVDSYKTETNSKENSSKSSKRKRKRREMNAQKGKAVPIQKDETDLEQISKSSKKRKKRRKRTKSNVKFTNETVKSPNQSIGNETNSKSKHKKIKSKQEKGQKSLEINRQSREVISSLADKYKKKLLNKLS